MHVFNIVVAVSLLLLVVGVVLMIIFYFESVEYPVGKFAFLEGPLYMFLLLL